MHVYVKQNHRYQVQWGMLQRTMLQQENATSNFFLCFGDRASQHNLSN